MNKAVGFNWAKLKVFKIRKGRGEVPLSLNT
jgi:hypothetical protein